MEWILQDNQPGINVDTNEDLDHWWFTCMVVMDRNFKAEHMDEWKSEDQVQLIVISMTLGLGPSPAQTPSPYLRSSLVLVRPRKPNSGPE
ncbi:hypothetical protein M404DRAFT_25134 [Pisolithus tinctorius Marx 270]|uniref:Uncharacterized protein n=1 Tax=Pisolithus tinctorius Marx 270 TaxID=870435 RepID=A0A0C3PDJ9_PISTI|nr:hypothetical protein M404DRAFT_25134 [Pisolithus tinctorius Marx 270]